MPIEVVPKDPDRFADDDGTETWHAHEAASTSSPCPTTSERPTPDVGLEAWLTNAHLAEFRPPDPELQPGDTVSLNWGSLEAETGDRTGREVDVAATHPDLNTLHAWVHTEHPDGEFAPVNPDFSAGPDH